MIINVTVEGLSPILMNRFPEDALDGGTAVSKGEKPLPREVADRSAYKDAEGFLGFPGPNILSSLVAAGRFHKLGKEKVTTMKTTLVTAGIAVREIFCHLLVDGKKTKHFEVDSRRGVNPSNQAAVMIHRARLDKWQCVFTIEVDTKMFSLQLTRCIVDDAGSKIGWGDYRPSRKGPFGRFNVIKWATEK